MSDLLFLVYLDSHDHSLKAEGVSSRTMTCPLLGYRIVEQCLQYLAS